MKCCLPGNILHTITKKLLLNIRERDTSSFGRVIPLGYQYALPHPLKLFEEQPGNGKFKSLVKAKASDYWQSKLRKNNQYMNNQYKIVLSSNLSFSKHAQGRVKQILL